MWRKTAAPGAEDDNGHGTNVTGIIASRGRTTPVGIAAGAFLVAIKVLDENGLGWLSDGIAALEHVIALHEPDNGIEVDVVNMGFGAEVRFTGSCDSAFPALRKVCSVAKQAGMVLFVSSGNGGEMPVFCCNVHELRKLRYDGRVSPALQH